MKMSEVEKQAMSMMRIGAMTLLHEAERRERRRLAGMQVVSVEVGSDGQFAQVNDEFDELSVLKGILDSLGDLEKNSKRRRMVGVKDWKVGTTLIDNNNALYTIKDDKGEFLKKSKKGFGKQKVYVQKEGDSTAIWLGVKEKGLRLQTDEEKRKAKVKVEKEDNARLTDSMFKARRPLGTYSLMKRVENLGSGETTETEHEFTLFVSEYDGTNVLVLHHDNWRGDIDYGWFYCSSPEFSRAIPDYEANQRISITLKGHMASDSGGKPQFGQTTYELTLKNVDGEDDVLSRMVTMMANRV